MKKLIKEEKRRSVISSKELKAILAGVAFTYIWQIAAYFMGDWSEGAMKPVEYLIPNSGVQIATGILVTWLCFRLFGVSWIKRWEKISLFGLAFIVPFAIISAVAVFIDMVFLWKTTNFWVGNVVASVIIAVTLFRPFIKVKL